MKTVRVGIPNQVVDDVGNVLDWAVVRGKGIDKQVMAKILQNQKRTFDEGVVMRQILIVPDQLALKRWEMDREPKQREKDTTHPGALEEGARFSEQPAVSSDGSGRRS